MSRLAQVLRHAKLEVYEAGERVSLSSMRHGPCVVIIMRGSVQILNPSIEASALAGQGALLGTPAGPSDPFRLLKLEAAGAVAVTYALPAQIFSVSMSAKVNYACPSSEAAACIWSMICRIWHVLRGMLMHELLAVQSRNASTNGILQCFCQHDGCKSALHVCTRGYGNTTTIGSNIEIPMHIS